MDYAIYLATLAMIFVGVAVGLRVLVGMCGIVSVCHAAFFGLGAYGAVLFERSIGIPPLVAPFFMAAAGALVGYIIARTALRIRDDYLVIFTLAVQLIFTNLLRNGGEVTGGPAGDVRGRHRSSDRRDHRFHTDRQSPIWKSSTYDARRRDIRTICRKKCICPKNVRVCDLRGNRSRDRFFVFPFYGFY